LCVNSVTPHRTHAKNTLMIFFAFSFLRLALANNNLHLASSEIEVEFFGTALRHPYTLDDLLIVEAIKTEEKNS
jgi:hypothetical protein